MVIIILGGGFAGLAAARKLAVLQGNHQVFLFDKNSYSTMLPSLPDAAGCRMPPQFLKEEIARLLPEGIEFKNENVCLVDLENRFIKTEKNQYCFDYLLFAAGSTSNFYGFNQSLERLYTLTTLTEAERIREDFAGYLYRAPHPHLVLSGAGYTALELAGNLSFAAQKSQKTLRITLAERAPDFLPFLSSSQKERIRRYIKRMKFDLKLNDFIEVFDGRNVRLHSGAEFEDVFFCWTAGTKFAIPQIIGKMDLLADGRIVVDECLRAPQYDGVFAAGDSAAMACGGGYLRKAVNFAIYSGARAGDNIVRSIRSKRLKPFRAVDLGWVIPLIDDSVGVVFGKIPVCGRLGLRMHYFMCGYRNFNWTNRRRFFQFSLTL